MKTKNRIIELAILFFTVILLAWPISCKKDSQPTPNPSSTDTITPVSPTDTIIPISSDTLPPIQGRVANFYYRNYSIHDSISGTWEVYIDVPTLDTIRYLANHPGCDTIYIKWMEISNHWTWTSFIIPRDSLEKRFQISPKVCGSKNPFPIRTRQILPDDISYTLVVGMRRCDSLWYANHGYEVMIAN